MEIGLFKLSNLNGSVLVRCVSLGNDTFHLGFQIYFHRSLSCLTIFENSKCEISVLGTWTGGGGINFRGHPAMLVKAGLGLGRRS